MTACISSDTLRRMLISAQIEEKANGSKLLIKNAELKLQESEKVGLIGRNGTGKTTLLRIMDGADSDYIGIVERRPKLVMITTDQEQAARPGVSVLDYVLDGLREYRTLTQIIEEYPDLMGEDLDKIAEYSDALERYAQYGYYHVVDQVRESLRAYQLQDSQIDGAFMNLSGGQKRFAQLVQVEYSNADLLILDEPTNHMDYVAKGVFVEWLKNTQSGVLVISHDRDVLAAVDRIVELKDRQLHSYPGSYKDFLKQNATSNVSAMHQYEVTVKTLENRREALKLAQIKKQRSKQSPNPFIPLVRRFEKEIAHLEESLVKPTIWIDQTSSAELKTSQAAQYQKYKTKNIRIKDKDLDVASHSQQLVLVDVLALGYDAPLFKDVSFSVRTGERVQIVGRNGAGKTTFVDVLCATATGKKFASTIFDGYIDCSPQLVIGRYKQEIDAAYLDITLGAAIAEIYRTSGQAVNHEAITQTLIEYLFEHSDSEVPVRQLSGGQKARVQLIAMLAHRPNLLILDEPTNHLDLPSIEELESALKKYTGAILYISHDSYFAKAVGGQTIEL